MSSIFFWKNWIKDYRYTWIVMAAVFVVPIAGLWIAYAKGTDNIIHWDRLQEQKTVETTVHTFRLGPLKLEVPADSYVILEHLNGSAIEPNLFAYYGFLVLLVLSAVVLITVVTAIEGFWFFVAMGFVMLFIVGMRLEVVGIYGRFDKIVPMGILVVYVLLAFYFNRLRPSTPFVIRLLSFAVLTSLVGCAVLFLADVSYPMIHLALTGYTPGMLLSILFIIMTAHEVFAFFVKAAGQGQSKNLRHLSIISFIYFLNLLIAALHEIGAVQWNFMYVNPYLILMVAAVVGIWGFRDREVLYGNIIPYNPLGAYLFLALGIICFATTGQLIANDNDPALIVIRHTIIFSHAGYGLIFMVYVVANFIQPLAEGKSLGTSLYQPERMPYFTYRLAGTIATLTFFFLSFWPSYLWNSTAGFYNMSGDLYGLMGDEQYVQAFYTKSKQQSVLNHRANYALAGIATDYLRFNEAQDFYKSANLKRPTPYSLVNNGNIYLWQSKFFDAVRSYRSIDNVRPDLGENLNNLGLAYSKIHRIDSAVHFFAKARDHQFTKSSAETNFLGMSAIELLAVNADSTLQYFDTDDAGVQANALAVATLFGQKFQTKIDPLRWRQLSLQQATLLNNYIVKNATTLDTTFTHKAYAIASDSLNANYSEALKASLAYGYYHQGNVKKALEILAELVYLSRDYAGKFNYIMGLWALEQRNPELAADYFGYATAYEYKQSEFYWAIALTECHRTSMALAAWDTLLVRDDPSTRAIALKMKSILSMPASNFQAMTDADLYQFNRYRVGTKDVAVLDQVLNNFKDANYKAQALLDVSRRFFEAGKTTEAIQYYSRISGLELTDSTLYNNVRHFELEMLASRKELQLLAKQINNGVHFEPSQFLHKLWYAALLSEASGDKAQAQKNYEILGSYNPYFVEGIIASADFFRRQDERGMKAYNILVDAVQHNKTSLKLLRAYREEAQRKEFDEHVADVTETIQRLEQQAGY